MRKIPVPDACSLSQPEFEDRLAWIRQEIPKARHSRAIEGGMLWEFDADPTLRDKLEQLVALETDCCDSDRIRFALKRDAGDGSLQLEVLGIGADSPLLDRKGVRPGPYAGLRRVATAGGLGALGAFAVLCVLPMALAAIAGAAFAAPLAGLESPLALAAGSLSFGALAWWGLRRRERRC